MAQCHVIRRFKIEDKPDEDGHLLDGLFHCIDEWKHRAWCDKVVSIIIALSPFGGDLQSSCKRGLGRERGRERRGGGLGVGFCEALCSTCCPHPIHVVDISK